MAAMWYLVLHDNKPIVSEGRYLFHNGENEMINVNAVDLEPHIGTTLSLEVELESGVGACLDLSQLAVPAEEPELVQEQVLEQELEPEKQKKPLWPDEATRLLLSEYPKFLKMQQAKTTMTLDGMWSLMLPSFTSRGYVFTAKQLKSKKESLERAWKAKTENTKKTGRGRIEIPFEKELQEIFGKKRSIIPEFTINSFSGTTTRKQLLGKVGVVESTEQTPLEDEDVDNPEVPASSLQLSEAIGLSSQVSCSASSSSTPSRRASSPGGETLSRPRTKNKQPSVAQVLEGLRADFQARNDAREKEHKERMEALAISNSLKKRRLELLETY